MEDKLTDHDTNGESSEIWVYSVLTHKNKHDGGVEPRQKTLRSFKYVSHVGYFYISFIAFTSLIRCPNGGLEVLGARVLVRTERPHNRGRRRNKYIARTHRDSRPPTRNPANQLRAPILGGGPFFGDGELSHDRQWWLTSSRNRQIVEREVS
ncbi:hypothetical protein BKA93DRAFT_185399 [Sparassis latifolia]